MKGLSTGRISVNEMNDRSMDNQIHGGAHVLELQIACIEALFPNDTRIAAQFPVELVVADINGVNPGRPSLQQAVGEAAG